MFLNLLNPSKLSLMPTNRFLTVFQKTAKLLLFVSYIQPVCYETKTKGAEAPSS